MLNDSDIIISITDPAKYQLAESKIITDETLLATIKPIKHRESAKPKPGLYVVLTAKDGHTPSWMMTYYDPTVTDIDLSNVPATELIDIWEQEGIDSAIRAFEEGISPLKKKKANMNTTGEDIPTHSLADLQKGDFSNFFKHTDDIPDFYR